MPFRSETAGSPVVFCSVRSLFRICHRTRALTRRQASSQITRSRVKIGHYVREMALQTADAAPVRYGPTQRWQRVAFDEGDLLPKDPRQWTRDHVAHWVSLVTDQHGLPQVPASRFLMNGKALCLMSPGMFLSRVPLGGKLLYKDFQLRLCAALYNVD